MQLFRIVILLIFFFFSFYIKGALPPDSINNSGFTTEKQLVINLDSMMNQWYVRQSISLQNNHTSNPAKAVIVGNDSIYAARLSQIPSLIKLPYNSVVGDYIRLYIEKIPRKTEILIGLTEYYFPLFEEILDAYGLPHELKYLPIIESALNPRAVSHAGATGIWQFMYTTGKLYGLEVNSFVDERRDPMKSSMAAAKYLKELNNLYNNWTLALAAYNCGPGTVNKAIMRTGGKTNYWDLYYLLPKETRGYVPCFIAAVYFMNYYKEHNLVPVKIQKPLITDTIMINEELHLRQVAEVMNIPIELLRDLNPQYKLDIIPAKEKAYPLRLPAQYSMQFIELKDSIFTFKDSFFFDLSKAAIAPKPTSAYSSQSPVNTSGYVTVYYTVKSGDNLGIIANKYHVTVSQIRIWNNLPGTTIHVGQKLAIRVPASKASQYKNINTSASVTQSSSVNATTHSGNTETTMYIVKAGETLWSISQKFGITVNDIINANNLSNKNIKVGQQLKIPNK